jgi:hypothetical protein
VLLALVVIGAGLLVVHVLLMLRVARAALPARVRWLGLLPPATPIVGWVAGARGLVVAWGLQCLVYGALLALA